MSKKDVFMMSLRGKAILEYLKTRKNFFSLNYT